MLPEMSPGVMEENTATRASSGCLGAVLHQL